jgi:hypothetical protein
MGADRTPDGTRTPNRSTDVPQATAHGGVCVWANRVALVSTTMVDHDLDDTIRYARRALPDLVHRD